MKVSGVSNDEDAHTADRPPVPRVMKTCDEHHAWSRVPVPVKLSCGFSSAG